MASAVMNQWLFRKRLGRSSWWAGPIFQKELRVASRRRRGYLLRCGYVLLLTLYIAMVWISAVSFARSGAMSRAQMQVAAHTITRGIVWFQFLGAQAVVLILMSTAISEEVYHRTLGILMTTPLSSRQVVRNKFVSRLFQVLLLVATSLPPLAVVRILGGIAWGYVIVSLCVTTAAVIFVGSVSLFFSALCRRAHIGLALSLWSLVVVFAVVPTLVDPHVWALRSHLAQLAATNPYVLLRFFPSASAPGAAALGAAEVATCCFVLLSGAWFLLTCTERLVVRVALRRAMGEPALLDRLRRGHFRRAATDHRRGKRRSGVRRVTGPPLIWKELTCTLSRRETFVSHTILGAEITLILIAYLFPMMTSVVPYEFLHLLYILGFLGAAVLLTITASAGVISVERESRAWPLLLLTPLTDREILLGKFAGVLRRCGPVWLVLLTYVAGFVYARCFHPLAAVQATILILSTLPFLTAAGFYFGSRFHRTTEAVTANLVLAGILWCIPPIVGAAAQPVLKGAWNGGESVAYTFTPFGQAFALVATTLDGYYGDIEWFGHSLNAGEVTVLMLVSMTGYLLAALLFAWRAVRGFRRRML